MKLSKTPFKTSKTRGTDEFKSIELMFQTGQLKRHSAGVYGFGQFLTRSLNKTIDLARRYLDKYDCIEVSLPLLQAKSVWAQSGRWDKYKASDTTFYCKGRDGEYFFSPTAEEFMSDIVKPHINSYKDLDCNVYQIGKKYRDEIRVRGGLTRSKEFIMHDGYSFASTKEGMEAEYAKMRKCYLELFKAMGIDALPVQAVNEYGGKISEEIMCFSHMGGDKVLYDEKTGFTCNVEVFDHPELMAMFKEQYGAIDRKRMVEKQAIEVGHI
ncbi:MAG: hypothetical protein FWD32_02135, partial [Firmicutes bacterium]|nr:hypothetical protein [Bacillota bacterium]